MIKVIASDMDGTLLDNDHQITPQTVEAIRRACSRGIRFIITTGRNFSQAMEQLHGCDITCDYILSSGAEIRNSRQEIVSRTAMDMDVCREVFQILQKWPVSVIFCTDSVDYRIGSPEMAEESILQQLKVFHMNMEPEELLKTELYQRIKENTRFIRDISELESTGKPVYKIFLFSGDVDMLKEIQKELSENPEIAPASSFETNLEITDVKAQKGPALKAYIESLGYTMDEVMVFGDSMNDYSMLSMDFGATVAVANAMPEIKAAAKYITKSNQGQGVAWAINHLENYEG